MAQCGRLGISGVCDERSLNRPFVKPDRLLSREHSSGSGEGDTLFQGQIAAESSESAASGSSSGRNGSSFDKGAQNLTELAAEPPTSRGQNTESQDHLEWKKDEEGLTELSAPAPVPLEDPSHGWRREEHLEGRAKEGEKTQEISRTATQLYIVCHLISFSMLGTLARLGTQWLGFYPGAIVTTSNLWANFGGTLFMGFLAEDRQLFKEEWGTPRNWNGEDETEIKKAHHKAKKTMPLFIGLTVGFCGSYTSFSTFMRDAFLALSNDAAVPPYQASSNYSPTSQIDRHAGYDFNAIVAVVILQVTVNISALKLGCHVAQMLDFFTPTIPFDFFRKVVEPVVAALGIGCWVGAIIIAVIPPDCSHGTTCTHERWRGQVLFALVFSPIGCLLRFLLSTRLNRIVGSFPLGTFAANAFGTAVEAAVYDVQHVPILKSSMNAAGVVGGGVVSCQVLQGIMDGFCGSLTTVSTWVLELTTLETKHGYTYGGASVAAGLALVITIMGSVKWSIGFSDLACAVEYS